MRIGVLAIQGDFDAHRRRLEELGAQVVLVRKPGELDAVDALVLPGGESTTFLKFLERDDFLEKLRGFACTKSVFGTCAGAILLAREVTNPPQAGLGVLEIRVCRNAYGRQLESSIRTGQTTLPGGGAMEMVFIRAPRIESIGEGVEVLATEGGDPVLVRRGKVMASTFHPELSADTRVHAAFLELAQNGSR